MQSALRCCGRSVLRCDSLLAARRGDPARVEELGESSDPDAELLANGTLLPGPDAVLAGPTFEEWLDSDSEPARPAGTASAA